VILAVKVKLSTWAKQQGISYKTAWRWFKNGTLPVPYEQVSSGTIIVKPITENETENLVALYARVSSHDQKKDLDRQLARLLIYANNRGLKVSQTVTEIGSGLNGPKLLKLLSDTKIKTIIVEHRDRLMRFGSEYVSASLAANNRQLLIVDEKELNDDLVQDMIEVLTSFCARLYGRRSAKNKAKKALSAMEEEEKK
jgi:predicted site-specific integrase-resolvase